MGKDLSIKQKKIKDDAAIERGRAMYEEWEAKKLPSRKIVSYAEAALWSMKRTKTWEKRINAIVYLFALDMRIRERYKSIKSLILFFFSRRREMRVFRRLLDALGMSVGKKGLRSAIEIELERIREKIKKMEADDDDTKGGKRTQKSDEKSEEREIGEQADTAEKSEKINEYWHALIIAVDFLMISAVPTKSLIFWVITICIPLYFLIRFAS